jgi:hypothetical protein
VPLLSILADLSGLTGEVRECRIVMTRIAEALERVSPPLPSRDLPSSPPVDPNTPLTHSFAESPSEYELRHSREAALAESMGFAEWSPDFQNLLFEMRQDLMQPSREYDEETGEWRDVPARSETEAEALIREAIGIAKSAANTR